MAGKGSMTRPATPALQIVPAGKGWHRIWRDGELIAACPSQRMANLVANALLAEQSLEIAEGKIALLEQTLQMRLKPGSFIVGIFGGHHHDENSKL